MFIYIWRWRCDAVRLAEEWMGECARVLKLRLPNHLSEQTEWQVYWRTFRFRYELDQTSRLWNIHAFLYSILFSRRRHRIHNTLAHETRTCRREKADEMVKVKGVKRKAQILSICNWPNEWIKFNEAIILFSSPNRHRLWSEHASQQHTFRVESA